MNMRTILLSGDASVGEGITLLSEILQVRLCEEAGDLRVEARPVQAMPAMDAMDTMAGESGALAVTGAAGAYTVAYTEKALFFRGLGLLLQQLSKGQDAVDIRETARFTLNGAMYDVSQGNAVMRVSTAKEILGRMAVMGLNMFMLYVEDSYDLEGWPYFGYMRSRYTKDELRKLDDYAWALGIEMIPCIQTLAHLVDALKWSAFRGMHEDADTLFVGEEKIYPFIEEMIAQNAAIFRTKRMHIGMDEAWRLGQGDYLLKNGYRPKYDIMNEHLNRVADICRKYDVRAMIWSDMYFRGVSETGSYYDMDAPIPAEVSDAAPGDIQLVYWDYYHDEPTFYVEWLKRHGAFHGGTVFAGGMWNWTGFGMNWGRTKKNTDAALTACKQAGCREVFCTIWGDDTTESSVYTTLIGLQLFAEHGFCETVDETAFDERLAFCTGLSGEDFKSISYLNEVPGVPEGNPRNFNPAKSLMWQDILAGLFDAEIADLDLGAHYGKWAVYYETAAARGDAFGLMDFSAKTARVLELKADLGKIIAAAYRAGDKETLRRAAEETLPELTRRVQALRACNRDYWMAHIKPLGWEVMDLRYGTLLARIDTAAYRLSAWLGGKIGAIEELEEPRLFFFETDRPLRRECNQYSRMPTASRISI